VEPLAKFILLSVAEELFQLLSYQWTCTNIIIIIIIIISISISSSNSSSNSSN
jgi:hypothetical protein